MTLHAALAAAATLVSIAFALSTLERYLRRGKRHELMWTISLFLFAAGSAALWCGAALGWSEWSFKAFYLFGAILNVPFLALGTVYLLGGTARGDRWAAVVSLLGAFAAGLVVSAPLLGPIDADTLPRGSEVFGAGPRIAAALGSGLAALVLIGGALWSIVRLGWCRLSLANGFIAAGTLVLSAGGVLNSVLDEMDAFAVSLVVGIGIIFVGFLITNTGETDRTARVEPWHLPPELASRLAA